MPSNKPSVVPPQSKQVQKSGVTNSEAESPDHGRTSVYDFLYHDSQRIASFLAQFETYGVLQNVKASESVGQASTSKATLVGEAGIPLTLKGSITTDGSVVDDERDSAERTYDPLWTNARLFLDYLEERELIQRDLTTARIGEFVLVTGGLAVFDLSILKQMWSIPAIKKLIMQGMKPDKSLQNRSAGNKAPGAHLKQQEENEATLALVQLLPHPVQATISAGERVVWTSLRENCLIVPSTDLLLKHGVKISGDWAILGVLDALPGGEEVEIEALDQALAAMSLGALGMMLGPLAQAVRMMLGRPDSAFGVTPLMIFRQVAGELATGTDSDG